MTGTLTDAEQLAALINEGLRELDWSRFRLACVTGISPPVVNALCAGTTRYPQQRTVLRVGRALGWDDDDARALVPRRPRPSAVHDQPRRPPRPDRPAQPPRPPRGPDRGPRHVHQRADVLWLQPPHVDPGPPAPLTLPDPALRWRSPRNAGGRIEQVERWTYALAVARRLVELAETTASDA